MPLLGAIVDPYFVPPMREISAITKADPAVITTSLDHLYLTGAIVRIKIPKGYGMEQLNEQQGSITVLSPTTFSIAIDSSLYDAFAIPSLPANYTVLQTAQVIPIGEETDHLDSAFHNTLN